MAYAEFKYYILNYLYYAKKHHPDVYKGIVNNKEFCKAYKTLESSYAKLIKEYETKWGFRSREAKNRRINM